MTTNKNKEEKRRMFFGMQEHPERYTDEQMEELLADEGMKEFFHDMAMARMAQQKASPKQVNVDEAWNEFALKQRKGHVMFSVRFKTAAAVVGVIFLSGITLAAMYSGAFGTAFSHDDRTAKTEQPLTHADIAKLDSTKADIKEGADSLNLKPVVFDDAELGDVVSQLAAFYHVKAEFENADAQHIRIFFNWDKKKTLQQNLKILNAFDRIHITLSPSDNTLKVE